MRFAIYIFIFVFALELGGCVTPPRVETAQVISDTELSLVTFINKGKVYAASGRLDLAEIEFRKALEIRPNLSSIYNDLGFTLQAQDRFVEATDMFRKAVQREPRNLAARENLGRILYAQGDADGAIVEFENLLAVYYGLSAREVKTLLGHEYTSGEIAALHRLIALAQYRAGHFDESICESAEAVKGPVGDFSQVGQHARLLLSLGLSQKTANYLHDVVEVWQEQTPGRLFVDYAIALLDSGNNSLAHEALTRSLTKKDLEEGDRRYIQVLLGVDATDPNLVSKGPLDLVDESGKEQFCELVALDPYGYWPLGVVKQAKTILSRWCHDEKQSVVSG